MESPPKRMTRARAAAKAGEPTVKTTKIITAAARAKSSATAGTKSTAAKRKTRADEHEEEEEAQREVPAPRRPRGRPKKAEDPAEAEAPARPARARITKKSATEASKGEPVPVKATRGRPKKVVAAAPAEVAATEPVQKTTRARATTTTRTTAAAKPVVKKSVKFQEPDKENIEPAIEANEPVNGGLRGRPAKRGTAVGTRTTRAAVRTATTDKKPLSPKKMTQMPVSKDDSEDELAGDSTPIKPLMKNPIKPRINTIAKSQPTPSEKETEPTLNTDTVLNPPDLTSVLTSPARKMAAPQLLDTMRSPARRIGSVQLPGSTMKPSSGLAGQTATTSPFKASLLQSAAKRPSSPIKGLNFGNAPKSQQSQSAMKASFLQSPAKRSFPGLVPLTEPRQRDTTALGASPTMKPLVLSGLPSAALDRPSAKLMMEDQPRDCVDDLEDDPFSAPMESLQFPGRLSAVLPRHADPVFKKGMGIVDEPTVEAQPDAGPDAVELAEQVHAATAEVDEQPIDMLAEPAYEAEDEMAVDELAADFEDDAEKPASASSSLSQSPVQTENPIYQLRDKVLDPYESMDSESEDEMEAAAQVVPATPTPFTHKTPKTQGTGRSQAKASRQSLGGFTALAERFGSWSAASPIKMVPLVPTTAAEPVPTQSSTPVSEVSQHFFEDEMSVRPDVNPEDLENQLGEVLEPSFDDIMVTEEDLALAHEANEMSLLEPEVLEGVANCDAFDDTLSEASQEYGDENQLPLDPALANSHSAALTTPVRPVMKTFNTTTKIPLKPADDSTPSPLKKRCFTASRVAPKRPTGPSRSATVISYSSKNDRKSLPVTSGELASTPANPGPVTPSKSDLWSSIGTPARTPRRDVDPALLRGAVVFVDVHTSEGADASSIFVELLTQMGAKCMKSWTWSPNGSGEVSSSKVGITHVVFKDGGKRTLEKVRETNGVVQCVGVSWVLDCERENEWLEEGPYYIDTKVVPRGGARRRKSMEPKALANMNGTLVSSPVKGSRTPSTPITSKNRRESANWMYTPSGQADDDMEEDHDWSNLMLTPVPKTPAPDAVARYAANLPETPSDDEEEDDEDYSPTKENLLMRTCPPKQNPFRDLGAGILSKDKDEQVLMRLMAARRKSLQFAPKIGSPLARAWQ
ncbi:hypothetical protein B0J13DRAFT_451171 [Dactylonectria estremocensis]|uniref:BRCT domain-containing protein n=1 Tax=Dactylonectria estremocensis TaxID=1079267 RepID=A0A9P9E6D6_9HYPO|nr:hypothetical protein B0J13DRAFT_451171 [Dactylonectria estremocensis]